MIAILWLLGPWQAQASAPSPGRDPAPIVLDGIALQAGDSVVTLSEFQRAEKRYQERLRPSSVAEAQRLRARVLEELAFVELEQQWGADRGLPAEVIENITRRNLDALREKAGPDTLGELAAQGRDILTENGGREELYRDLWRLSAIGVQIGAVQRATRDQTIRPGELRSIFEEYKDELASPTVRLRLLIVSSQSAGGPDAARAACEDARRKVEAGEDMGLLVEDLGADLRESGGLTPPIAPASILDPVLRAFAEKAEIGTLSEVVPILGKGGEEGIGYQMAQLYDRRRPPEPVFDSPDVQRTLREYFTQKRREALLERGRQSLKQARLPEEASWTNPLLLPAENEPGAGPAGEAPAALRR